MKLYIKEEEHYRTDAIFFLIGLVLFFPLFAFGLWFGHTGYNRIGQMFACGFQRVTGFPCPGCGARVRFIICSGESFLRAFYITRRFFMAWALIWNLWHYIYTGII